MTIEIHKPELERMVQDLSSHFDSVDDLFTEALQALQEKYSYSPLPPRTKNSEITHRTGSALIAALQASPYRELNIEPARYRMPARNVAL